MGCHVNSPASLRDLLISQLSENQRASGHDEDMSPCDAPKQRQFAQKRYLICVRYLTHLVKNFTSRAARSSSSCSFLRESIASGRSSNPISRRPIRGRDGSSTAANLWYWR